jgi:hypothetical protein
MLNGASLKSSLQRKPQDACDQAGKADGGELWPFLVSRQVPSVASGNGFEIDKRCNEMG